MAELFLTAPRTKPTPFLVVIGWSKRVELRDGDIPSGMAWLVPGGQCGPGKAMDTTLVPRYPSLSEVPGKHRNLVSSFSLLFFLSLPLLLQ